ncbi:MAG: AhpC/TSA family protein [Chloroflexi bacterium]|nr:AhpC/TSA family protein [Chloroflexota bacterium]MBI3341388.1 AhpC/TSA family protein [Chloroflexota bacterium]
MTNLAPLKFNDPAPDMELRDVDGKPVRLASLWKKQVLILAFTRHFGCPQCKEMIDRLVTFLPDFKARHLSLAIITQGMPEEAKAFCSERAPGVLCLADPERKAYAAYGLERANVWQSFLSLNVWRSNRRLKRVKGWRTDFPPGGQDALQMAGTFLIAPDGRIRLPYYYDDIADHPSVDLLLHGVMGMDWNQTFDGPVAPK